MIKLNLKDLENNQLILVVASGDQVQQINLEILRYFVGKKNSSCVYITIAKPYKTILNILSKNNIKADKFFFIDCATGLATGSEELQRAGNYIFCPPQLLTDLSIALSTALKGLPKDDNRILVLDTVSTLMLYNKATTVSKFMHVLTGKLRKWGIKSVILTLEEETDKKVISQLSQFSDKVITLKEQAVNNQIRQV